MNVSVPLLPPANSDGGQALSNEPFLKTVTAMCTSLAPAGIVMSLLSVGGQLNVSGGGGV